ncbi:MAG: PilW family protein [Limnohabitans sp.]
MSIRRKNQRGETLVGLLVGMALGLWVLAAGVQMLAHLLRGHRQVLQDSHLQQDLHFAMDLMARELQHAQYVAQAWRTRSPGTCGDAFCDEATDFLTGDNRIEFSMDRNHNGLQDNNECMGFRVVDGVLSRRTGCHSGGWQPLSDKTAAVVSSLQVQLSCTAVNGWLYRQLDLQLDAHGPDDPDRGLRLQRKVPVHTPLPVVVQERFCP